MGRNDLKSDIDFLVDLAPGRSLLDLCALQRELEHLLATQVDVILEWRHEYVTLLLEDNGVGFIASNPETTSHGLGLIGMRERAGLVGREAGAVPEVRVRDAPGGSRHLRRARPGPAPDRAAASSAGPGSDGCAGVWSRRRTSRLWRASAW